MTRGWPDVERWQRRTPRALFWLCAWGTLSGCLTVRSLRVGDDVPPRAAGCELRVERITPEDRVGRYRTIGRLCVQSGPREWNEERAAEAVRPAACELGGDVAALDGFCDRGVEYVVLRAVPAH